jgi:hypothetical protein
VGLDFDDQVLGAGRVALRPNFSKTKDLSSVTKLSRVFSCILVRSERKMKVFANKHSAFFRAGVSTFLINLSTIGEFGEA